MADGVGGYVAEIVRYPVKGLGGQILEATGISSAGIPFDRAFGLTHDRVPLAPFGQWSTYEAFHALDARPDLGGYAASIDEVGQLEITSPDDGALHLQIGDRGELGASPHQAAVITDWFGTPSAVARLIASGFHLWDLEDAPISIINLATLRALGAEAGASLDPRRFRGNLYLDGLEPWEELSFRGRYVEVGGVVLEVLRPIERCRAITVEPSDGTTDINLLAVLGGRFGHIFCGMYARVVSAGSVKTGDLVRVGSPVDRPAVQELTPRERAYAPRFAKIVAVSAPSSDAVSLEIADSAGELAHATPGQYLRLHRTTSEAPSWRNYTISRVSGKTSRITVERSDGGRFSPWVHELSAGDELVISGPYGDPTFPDDADEVLLLTAGIGITPALAILNVLGSSPIVRPSVLSMWRVPAGRFLTSMSTSRQSQAVGGTVRLHLTRERGVSGPHRQAGRDGVESLIGDRRHVWVVICGFGRFETEMRATVVGSRRSRQTTSPPTRFTHHVTSCRSRVPRPFPARSRSPLSTVRSVSTTRWTRESGTLLDVAEAAGVPARAACRAGACGTCVMAVHGSTAYLTDPVFEPRQGTVLVCSAVPTDDVVVEARLP